MARYLVLYNANPSVWPTDPKQALAVLEGAIAGGDQLLKMGALKEVGWLTPHDGFGIFETDSKDALLEMIEPFFPYYSPVIHEIVPWEKGSQAILNGARQAASR